LVWIGSGLSAFSYAAQAGFRPPTRINMESWNTLPSLLALCAFVFRSQHHTKTLGQAESTRWFKHGTRQNVRVLLARWKNQQILNANYFQKMFPNLLAVQISVKGLSFRVKN
jgi:hypothetical protein